MSLAGRRPDVLLTPITDNIRLNATIMGIKIRKYSSITRIRLSYI